VKPLYPPLIPPAAASGKTAVLKHFQECMPHGLVVPDAAEPPDDG
jgi:hypothetical protein